VARSRRSSVANLRERVEKRARRRCEYCHAPQRVSGYRFHLEHIIPSAAGGSDAIRNRALACATCNLAKGEKTSGIDPRSKVEVNLNSVRPNCCCGR
jgi:5-methylcytosine-specific restriction endonuclease McrA